jgi:hypothetical protein
MRLLVACMTNSSLLLRGHDRLQHVLGLTVRALAMQAALSVAGRGPVVDIAVSGLPGWVALHSEQGKGRLQLRIWTPPGIEAYVRPPLPVS